MMVTLSVEKYVDLDMRVKDLPYFLAALTPALLIRVRTCFLLIAMVTLNRWYMILVNIKAAFAYNNKRDHPMYSRFKLQ